MAAGASVSSKAAGGWQELGAVDAAAWNWRLRETGASVFQYPFWNEALRPMRFHPRYLVYSADGIVLVYATILITGANGFRVGLVARGPVPLAGSGPELDRALAQLADWARREGLVFLRCTHMDPEVLARIAQLPGARRADPFPFFRDPLHDLLVAQTGTDAEILAGFQAVARRNLRHAEAANYRIESTEEAARLRELWPLFERLAHRKGFAYRPLESFLALLREAQPSHAARVYAAYLDHRPVQALLVVRDRDTAHYIIGALDVHVLQDRPSPAVLLHWLAMREFAGESVRFYNLGTRSGEVYQFKRKFRPLERQHPAPVTIVFRPLPFRLWTVAALGPATRLWPTAKRLAARLRRGPTEPVLE